MPEFTQLHVLQQIDCGLARASTRWSQSLCTSKVATNADAGVSILRTGACVQIHRVISRDWKLWHDRVQSAWRRDGHDNNWLLLEFALSLPFAIGLKTEAVSRSLAATMIAEVTASMRHTALLTSVSFRAWHPRRTGADGMIMHRPSRAGPSGRSFQRGSISST